MERGEELSQGSVPIIWTRLPCGERVRRSFSYFNLQATTEHLNCNTVF